MNIYSRFFCILSLSNPQQMGVKLDKVQMASLDCKWKGVYELKFDIHCMDSKLNTPHKINFTVLLL